MHRGCLFRSPGHCKQTACGFRRGTQSRPERGGPELSCVFSVRLVCLSGPAKRDTPTRVGRRRPPPSTQVGKEPTMVSIWQTINFENDANSKSEEKFPYHGLLRTSYRSILLGVLRASIHGEAAQKTSGASIVKLIPAGAQESRAVAAQFAEICRVTRARTPQSRLASAARR